MLSVQMFTGEIMSKLDDLDYVQRLDKSDMAHKIIHMPEQIYFGYKESVIHVPSELPNFNEGNGIKQVVICGMGGSAISGDIVQVLFGSLVPIIVVKDFHLPYIDGNTLFIAVSYSGNTEETIECLNKAIEKTKFITCVTSGGKIKDLIDDNHLWIEVKGGMPPRAAIGYLFFSLLKLLEIIDVIPNQHDHLETVVGSLMQKAGSLCLKTGVEKNLAKSSAETIFGKIPVIYSSNPLLYPVAYRWKCQINENAKMPAFCHSMPEMIHNEVEAWEGGIRNSEFIPIFLRLFDEDERYRAKVVRFQELLEKQGIEFLEFYGDSTNTPSPLGEDKGEVSGGHQLCNIFTLIYLGDMISFCLGIFNEIDPTEIEFINYMKA